MYLMEEIPERTRPAAQAVVKVFDKEVSERGLDLRESLAVAGHVYEVMWLIYIRTMIDEGKESAGKMVGFMHKVQEGLNTCLVHWARKCGKESGKDSTNLIQIPGNH